MTGPGEVKALVETRICIFCHTPHNAEPQTPLWNKAVPSSNYELYSSTTMVAVLQQPAGPSRLCLSCHDGTIALGAVLRPAQGLAVTREITLERPAYLGTALSDDHPVSFSYYVSTGNPEIKPPLPEGLIFYGAGYIHCSTCHDAHDNTYGKFLVMDSRASALCLKCHAKGGWDQSTHKSSLQTLPSPLPGLEWTGWSTVADYGCESCHKPHSAGGPERLLRHLREEDNCNNCHNGTVAQKNVYSQFLKASRHPVDVTVGIHDPTESFTLTVNRHVECADCHNPHAVNQTAASAPYVSGKLLKVSGMDRNRGAVNPAVYEYEICYKCHADAIQKIPFIPRVINNTNAQEEFDQTNPSYHPVVGVGKNPNVPSIPSSFEPGLTASSSIYCSDCHSDDTGASKGPHGSAFPPILKERYETVDGIPENYQNYALCYRCHERTSILSDNSFRKKALTNRGGHSGHLAAGAPCSVCHDPHGIRDDGLSGSHTNLINFDTRTVSPLGSTPPNDKPRFNDTGLFSGNCSLICHGRSHSNESYP